MYIIIFENGELRKTNHLFTGDFEDATNGIINILDISDELNPKYYIQHKWQKVNFTACLWTAINLKNVLTNY